MILHTLQHTHSIFINHSLRLYLILLTIYNSIGFVLIVNAEVMKLYWELGFIYNIIIIIYYVHNIVILTQYFTVR